MKTKKDVERTEMNANKMQTKSKTETLAVVNGLVFVGDRFRASSIIVEGNKIIAVGNASEIEKDYSWSREIDANRCVVLPGLVDAHMHSFQVGVRFQSFNRPLLKWLKERVFPWEAGLNAKSARACALVAYSEMLKSGTTCVSDFTSVHHTHEAFKAAEEIGIRACIGKTMMDTNAPKGLKQTTEQSLAESKKLIERWHGKSGGRLRFMLTPRFDVCCSDELFVGCKQLSEKYNVKVQTHAQENYGECKFEEEKFGCREIKHLNKLGLLNEKLLLVHCVWLSGEDKRLLKERRVSIAHCPGSNLALGSGVAPIPELLKKGMAIGLGSDVGAFDRFSLFDEMRLAMLAQRLVKESKGISQEQVLRMATVGGAKCLGLEKEVGELKTGMKADLVILEKPAFVDEKNCLGWVTQAASEQNVKDVIVDGRAVVRERTLTTFSEEKIAKEAERYLVRTFNASA